MCAALSEPRDRGDEKTAGSESGLGFRSPGRCPTARRSEGTGQPVESEGCRSGDNKCVMLTIVAAVRILLTLGRCAQGLEQVHDTGKTLKGN